MHVIPDLKRLEAAYTKELAVVGIHSAKFEGEKHTEAIRDAARRYGLRHPILNDAHSKVWDRYHVRAWPTVVVIDTHGRYVGRVEGEGHYETLARTIAGLVAEGEKDRSLVRGELDLVKPPAMPTGELAFPGRVLASPDGKRLFVADTLHHRVLVLSPDGVIEQVVGTGDAGNTDGPSSRALFNTPQGLALDGDKRLLVADTEGHTIRAISLTNWTVTTLAGTGRQEFTRGFPDPMPARVTSLNSPWDVKLRGTTAIIAMAGDHRLWSLDLTAGTVAPLAGSGRENIDDGSFSAASFSQPSGLALAGGTLYVADSEDSAVRAVDLDKGAVSTVVGLGLFEFGDVDGKGRRVRLQHPLDLVVWNDKLIVADTYNHKLKLIDPKTQTSATFAGTGERGNANGKLAEATFREPSGLSLAGDRLYVADTNNHAIRVIDLKAGTVSTLDVRRAE